MKPKDTIIREGVNTDDMEEFYTIEEIAKVMKLSRVTLYRYIKSGKLSAIKVPGPGKGGALRFRSKDLDNFAKKFAYKPSIA